MTSRRSLLIDATARLEEAGAAEARLDAEWLLAHATGMPRLSLLVAQQEAVSDDQAERFAALLSRRARGEPLQYVLGEAWFMGHRFSVDQRVLIPRSDTETLCEAAIARLAGGGRMLDIGTGSGALAASVAVACPAARIVAVDISAEALAVARANGQALDVQIEWIQSDLFAALKGRAFDVIVSNPPYIATDALAALQPEVRAEPRLALDGGTDGLTFYRRIMAGLPAHLDRGGSLLLEVGDGQARDVCALLDGAFASVHILRDLSGLDRVVTGDGYAG